MFELHIIYLHKSNLVIMMIYPFMKNYPNRHVVQTKIHAFQNPVNCDQARILICQSKKSNGIIDCGFGCLINHLLMCFFNAFASKRMLVFDGKLFGLQSFLPYSGKCTRSILFL